MACRYLKIDSQYSFVEKWLLFACWTYVLKCSQTFSMNLFNKKKHCFHLDIGNLKLFGTF